MATKTTATAALIVATFALVGLLSTGAVVPAAFAQVADENGNGDSTTSATGFLDDLLGLDNGNGGTEETETETETTEQSGDQSETNVQSNEIDQDQTAAINEEMTDISSDAESDAESTYKTKSKHGSTPIPGTATSDSSAASDVSNTGTIGQNQELNDATQVNSNEFGGDESRAAVVGFDFEFEQSVEEELDLVDEEPTPVDNNGPTALLDGLL
jgi:hypothetical protein